jgi:hypothetical protein
MTSPQELKDIIIATIKRYHLNYYLNNSPKYSSDEMHEKTAIEARQGDNLMHIVNECYKDQKIIEHITYIINTNNYDIVNDYYNNFILAKYDEKIDIYDDNKLSIKLYPIMIYMYMQIFRDVTLNSKNIIMWFYNHKK